MNSNGWIILLIPMAGLCAIFRDGRFRWIVVPSSALGSAVFWFGWCSALLVGVLVLLGF